MDKSLSLEEKDDVVMAQSRKLQPACKQRWLQCGQFVVGKDLDTVWLNTAVQLYSPQSSDTSQTSPLASKKGSCAWVLGSFPDGNFEVNLMDSGNVYLTCTETF